MKYFKPKEFACKCGRCGKGFPDMDSFFLAKLEEARELAGVAFTITSAYRCETHNANVGGKPNSAHLRGLAVDIATPTSERRFHVVKGLLLAGFKRIGINMDKNFVHVDSDTSLPQTVIFKY